MSGSHPAPLATSILMGQEVWASEGHALERQQQQQQRAQRLLHRSGLLFCGALMVFCCFMAARNHRREARGGHTSSALVEHAMSKQLLDIGGPVANTCGKLDTDVDFQYSALSGVGHLDNVVSSQDCCTLCQGEPSCNAFTWVKDAHLVIGNPGQCWLKGGKYQGRHVKLGVFSAFVRDPDTERKVQKDEEEEKRLAAIKKKVDAAKKRKEAQEAKRKAAVEAQKKVEARAKAKQQEEKKKKAEAQKRAEALAEKKRLEEEARRRTTTTTTSSTETTTTVTKTTTLEVTSTETETATTATSTRTTRTTTTTKSMACCAFEPFLGCGTALNISYYCDLSKHRCEEECEGTWAVEGADSVTDGLDVQPPTQPPKPTPPPEREDQGPCCSFEPLKACGDELAISSYCDASQKTCEQECAGKWLEQGPKQKAEGIDLYAVYSPASAPSSPAMK